MWSEDHRIKVFGHRRGRMGHVGFLVKTTPALEDVTRRDSSTLAARDFHLHGTETVLYFAMRHFTLLTLAICSFAVCATAVGACESTALPTLAGVGGGSVSGTTSSSLTVSPVQVQMTVGTTFQLATNASLAQLPQLQWSSLQPAVATVSATGLVSATGAGTATITVRVSSDTTQAAAATIVVSP
jgi:hypothetical protein